MTLPAALTPGDVSGIHVGLRSEAMDCLRSGGIPASELRIRDAREKAREWGDWEAVALWSRLLWRHYAKSRYIHRHMQVVVSTPPEAT